MALNLDTDHLRSPKTELGLLVLLIAQILSAYMGIYVQDMYSQHGTHWHENLFYSHLLSLPLFLPLASLLRAQYSRLSASPPYLIPSDSLFARLLPEPMQNSLARLPTSLVHLATNSITQLVCITGVNLLGAKSSAVTVTIVLNVRKLVSFMLSVWLFGNPMSALMGVGAALVFGSGALYGWETSWRMKRRKRTEEGMNGRVKENGMVKKEL
jgi:drug/metabolite transporter (DMT)-like permease